MILIAVVLTVITSIVLFEPNHSTLKTDELESVLSAKKTTVEEYHNNAPIEKVFQNMLLIAGATNFISNPHPYEMIITSKKFGSITYNGAIHSSITVQPNSLLKITLGKRHANDIFNLRCGDYIYTLPINENKIPMIKLLDRHLRFASEIKEFNFWSLQIQDDRLVDLSIHCLNKQCKYQRLDINKFLISLPKIIFSSESNWYDYVFGIKKIQGIRFFTMPKTIFTNLRSSAVLIKTDIGYDDGVNKDIQTLTFNMPLVYFEPKNPQEAAYQRQTIKRVIEKADLK